MDVETLLCGNTLQLHTAECVPTVIGNSLALSIDGVDGRNTKIISMVCCDLIEQSAVSVPIRAQEPVIVYLNDEYWGLYTRREHIEDAIARFEGLDDATILNIANANCATVYGNATGLKEVIRKLMNLNGSSDESQQIQNHLLDVESFLKCLALNAYFGNSNFYGSLFFYQINDGPWKCAMGDLAYSFTTAQDNSIARFVSQGKGGIPHGDIAIIADQLLKVPEYRDLFLAQMGALYQTLTTPLMQAAADAAYLRIADALPAHDDRWTSEFIQAAGDDMSYPVTDVAEAKLFHNYRVYRLRDKTMLTRPWYVFDSVQRELQVTDDDMERYFGSLSPDLPEVPGDNWDSYKSANQ